MFGGKPAFGSSTTSAFGGGASTFGTGSTNAFGSSPFGAPKPSVFGQSTQQQSTSLFGAKPAGTSLFGSSTPSAFGSATTASTAGGLFGQAKPSLFGASSGNSSFGQTSTSLFGNAGAASTSSMFGSTAAAPIPNGTTQKFNPVVGTDTMQKNGTNQNIQTKHMCITAMKEYEAKSLEELRVDDYLANRKAPVAGSTLGGGLFGSSTLSNTGSSGLFGQPTQQKSIFGSANSAFGQPAASTSTSLFGAQTANTSTAGSSLFGTPKPATTSLFGQPVSTGGTTFGQPAATTSLFGQPQTAPTFGSAPTGTTSLFGAPATSTASTGFTFGAPAASTASTFNAFGQPVASTAGATSLFGKPAAPTNFSFNTAATTNAFGQPTAQTTSLFAAKPTTTFGAPATTSIFGAQPAQQSTGLFNTQPQASAFGAQVVAPAVQQVAAAPIELVTNISQMQMEMAMINAQLAASPYGDSPLLNVKKAADADSDAHPNPNNVQRQLRFIASKRDGPILPTATPTTTTITTTSSSGSATTVSSAAAGTATRNLVARVLDVTIGATNLRSPLSANDLKYSPCVTAPTLGRGLRSATPAMHNSSLNSSRSLNASFMNKTRDGMDSAVEQSLRGGTNRLTLGSGVKTNLKHLDVSLLGDVSRSKSQMSASTGRKENEKGAAGDGGGEGDGEQRDPDELPRIQQSGILSPLQPPSDQQRARDATLRNRQPPPMYLDSTNDESSLHERGHNESSVMTTSSCTTNTSIGRPEDTEKRGSPRGGAAQPARVVEGTGVKLVSPDYYTTPSIEAMRDMVRDGAVVLADGLTIGRLTYGSVFWPGRVVLKNITLDEVVVFRHKEVTVYPDDSQKPPLGEQLNRPAEVTLERVWPHDKHSLVDIKDAEMLVNMGWREKLEARTHKIGANFKDYRPLTGAWVFRVKHFSKYGLPDEEDEDEEMMAQSMKENELQGKVQRAKVNQAAGGDATTAGGAPVQATQQSQQQRQSLVAGTVADTIMEEEEEREMTRRLIRSGGLGGSSSSWPTRGRHFEYSDTADEEGDEDGDEVIGWRNRAVPEKKIKLEVPDIADINEEARRMLEAMDPARLAHPTQHHITLEERERVRHFDSHAPAAQEATGKKKKDAGVPCLRQPLKTGLMDETASRGATAPVGWSAGGLTVSSELPGRNAFRLCLRSFPKDYPTQYVVDMFEHHQRLSHVITRQRSSSNRAKHCELLMEQERCAPRIKPTNDYVQLIDCFLATADQSGREAEALVWALCKCLFPADRGHSSASWEWKRKEVLGGWLKIALTAEGVGEKEEQAREGGERGKRERGGGVWRRLTVGDLDGAIDVAIEDGLTVLASLLGVFAVDAELTQELFEQQLDSWCKSGAIRHLSKPMLKCYLTLAGRTHLENKHVKVNCLEGLDWKQCLGLRIWYSRWAEPLGPCVEYIEAEEAAKRLRLPPLDTYLELIRVAVDNTRSLERVLDAAVEGAPAYNDYHLAWHIWSITRAAQLPMMGAGAEQALHAGHAEQLIAAGLPHLALFVLAHVHNAQCRSLLMREVVDRCALLGAPVDYAKASALCRLPEEWCAWARHLSAKLRKDEDAACEEALAAGEYELAHRLFVTQVAPDLLVSEELTELRRMCQLFEESSDYISAWAIGGQVYSEFLALRELLEDDERDEHPELEVNEAEEADVASRVRELRERIQRKLVIDEHSTPIQQLAITTMAKEMAELVRRSGETEIVMDVAPPLAMKSVVELVKDLDVTMDD